jgi:hypothetical protein
MSMKDLQAKAPSANGLAGSLCALTAATEGRGRHSAALQASSMLFAA